MWLEYEIFDQLSIEKLIVVSRRTKTTIQTPLFQTTKSLSRSMTYLRRHHLVSGFRFFVQLGEREHMEGPPQSGLRPPPGCCGAGTDCGDRGHDPGQYE